MGRKYFSCYTHGVFLDLGLPTLIGPVAVMAHIAIAALVTVHILLYKRNVAASVSWIGIAWLSPFLGALLYVTMGINRVKRRAQRLLEQRDVLVTRHQRAWSG